MGSLFVVESVFKGKVWNGRSESVSRQEKISRTDYSNSNSYVEVVVSLARNEPTLSSRIYISTPHISFFASEEPDMIWELSAEYTTELTIEVWPLL